MAVAQVEILNYRCFSGEASLIVPIDRPVVAYVGPNNAGKTTAIRSVFELRNFWGSFYPESLVSIHTNGVGLPAAHAVKQGDEIFPDSGDDPLSIAFQFSEPDDGEPRANMIRLITARFDRVQNRTTTTIVLWSGEKIPQGTPLTWDSNRECFEVGGDKTIAFARGLRFAVQVLSGCFFIPSVRSANTEISGSLYETKQGKELAQQWNAARTEGARATKLTCISLEQALAKIFGFEKLNILVSKANEFTIEINDSPRRMEEIGNGFANLLFIVVTLGLRAQSMIAIDEPEAGLHPALQIEFLHLLNSLSNGHLLFATHSLGLSYLANVTYTVKRKAGITVLQEKSRTADLSEFLGEMSFSAWSEVGFDALLLVEGADEWKSYPHILRELGLDTKVAMFSLHGNEAIHAKNDHYICQFRRLNCPVYVLIDSEKAVAGELSEARSAFLAACGRLGYRAKALDRRAIENYVSDRAAKQVAGNSARSLGEFEKHETRESGWSTRQLPLLFAAMDWDELKDTDMGQFFSNMKFDLVHPVK